MNNRLFYKLVFTVFAVLFATELMAQVPQGFNFQAVARGNDGLPLSEQQIGVEVNVVKGSESGDIVYTESHVITTSVAGLIQIVIGEGTPAENSDFSTIDWGNDNYYVNLGIDTQGGTSYEDLGTTRLLSVPYALLAENVVNGSGTGGELGTEINLDSSQPDSSFKVTVEGLNSSSAIIATASTDSTNAGLEGHAESGSMNESLQVGTYGEASGSGTGRHLGVYGVALGDESASGDGERRYGLYGYARSTGRENIGGFGIGSGAGDGEVIALGDEFASGSFNVGGFNISLVGFARDNLNGNIGIRGYTYGSEGARENRAVSAEAVGTATGQNIGVQALVNSSQTKNIGFQALMFDNDSGVTSETNEGLSFDISNAASVSNKGGIISVQGSSPDNLGLEMSVTGGTNTNTGMILNVNGGTGSNVGMTVNAPTAAELNGNVIVAGDLSATSVTQTSDRRLKKNIQSLENALNNTLKLRGVTYTWIDESKSQERQTGLIAQEVEAVFPEFVKTDTQGMKSVNYAQMTAVLIEAVKELNAKIESLETENSELQALVEDQAKLEQRMAQIEQLLKLNATENSSADLSADK